MSMCLAVLLSVGCSTAPTVPYLPTAPTVSTAAGGFSGLIDEPTFDGKLFIYEDGPPRSAESTEPDILLVHGLSRDGSGDWRHLVPGLAERHRLLSFDLPGFARSERQNTLYSPDRYTQLIDWLIETRLRKPVIMIGHSLGATLSLDYATQHPENVDKLVLIAPVGIVHRSAYVKFLAEVPDDSFLARSSEVEEAVNSFFGWMVEESEDLPIDMKSLLSSPRMRRNVLRDEPSAVAGAALMELDFSHKLPNLEIPTLVLWGAGDDIAPLRIGRVLVAQLPNARLEVLPSAGHAPQLDEPVVVSRRLREVLRSWPEPQPVQPPPWVASDRQGECNGTDEVSLTGAYDEIRIEGCERVTLIDVTARLIDIRDSRVTMTGVTVRGDDVALRVEDASVVITNAYFEADTAVELNDCRVDLASVELTGRTHAVYAVDSSTGVFSLCTINSPHGSGGLHGIYNIGRDSPI